MRTTDPSGRQSAGGQTAPVTGCRASARGRRGQTNIDFALGIGLFITVLVFTFTVGSGVLTPFTAGNQEESVVADRVADRLSKGLLGNVSRPYVLDRECTTAFFEQRDPDASGEKPCQYLANDGGEYTLGEQVGVRDRTVLNVTVTADINTDHDADILCWAPDDRTLEEDDTGCGGANDVLFSRGIRPSANDVVTARRVVSIGNHNATMYVHVS